jgi:CheY-like chemotaxis protein
LNICVIETLNLLENVIGGGIEIKVDLASNLRTVRGDATQLEQVLMNLCINARDAMPNGGMLFIESSNADIDDQGPAAAGADSRQGRFAVISVSDTGIGMDSATQDRIFEPLFTTKETGKGTGLGLATAHSIVRQHGGFMKIESNPGCGSTFRIFLPASADPPLASAARPDTRPVSGGSETILLAEGHDGQRDLAREILVKLGYQVILASNGERAVREFLARPGQINLLVFDTDLPKLSGLEAYSLICAIESGIPILFTSSDSQDTSLRNFLQEQGLPVIEKPYLPRLLSQMVRDTLEGRIFAFAPK